MDQGRIRGRVGGRGAAAVLLATLGLAVAAPARGDTIGFLYVEPGAGSAGGGHFGIQLGGDVYHFQSADRWIRLARWNADFFRYAYGVRENRGIRVARIEVDADTATAIERSFARRYGVERKHRAVAASLEHDRMLLERLRARPEPAEDAPPFPLPGAGWFQRGDSEPALARVRARVSAVHGRDHLSERAAALRAEILALPPQAAPDRFELSADDLPAVAPRFSERFADRTLELLAVETLRDGGRLAPRMLRHLSGSQASLAPAERRALARTSADLEARIVALLHSPRPDRGSPLLLAMARLVAVDASLATGRLVVLDAWPAAADVVEPAAVQRRRDFFEGLHVEAARELDGARSRLAAAASVDELVYQALEESVNRFLELDLALAGAPLRVSGEPLVPEGPVRRGGWLLPSAPGAGLDAVVEAAGAAEEGFARAAARLYEYDLLRRNCVTQIFRTIDAAVPPAEAERRLGGRVDPDAFLHFVPAVAFAAVTDRYRVRDVVAMPSFRRARLAAMAARDGRLATYLRESSTLSSSLYRGDDGDSAFLFFTDDAVWPRPVFGAFNLAAGLGQLSWGILLAPFDRGAQLTAGAQGVVFSLPELVFVNLRKGSMAYGRSEAAAFGFEPR